MADGPRAARSSRHGLVGLEQADPAKPAIGFADAKDLDRRTALDARSRPHFASEIDDLAARMDELIAAHTIPGWFERDCRKRELTAVRTTEPITVDGRLDEAVWNNAPRIEHFLDWRKLRLESLETVGRLAYDDDRVYVAMECFDPNPAGITAAMPAADQYRLCDSVEVFFAPRTGNSLAHWIIDSRGTVFDARTETDRRRPLRVHGEMERCGVSQGDPRRPIVGRWKWRFLARTSACGWSRTPPLASCCAATSFTPGRKASTSRTPASFWTATSFRPWTNSPRYALPVPKPHVPNRKWTSRYDP